MTVTTEFGEQKGDVVNIIPEQRAPKIARDTNLVDPWGWCPIAPQSFESTLTKFVHVVGDAANGVLMAKSATSANSQAKVCARAVAALFAGKSPETPSFAGTCYSTIAPDFAVAVTDVYRAGWESLRDARTVRTRDLYSIREMLGPRGYTEVNFTPEMRRQAAEYAKAWYAGIVADSFG
jgi:sulfide dehydrogenase [flavocytochrome c] flavoprotein subunit